jgi:hypothetical protein
MKGVKYSFVLTKCNNFIIPLLGLIILSMAILHMICEGEANT